MNNRGVCNDAGRSVSDLGAGGVDLVAMGDSCAFCADVCVGKDIPFDLSGLAETADWFDAAPDLAMVLDLPGDKAIKLGLALAQKEFRPAPLIDGSPGPGVNGLGEAWVESEPLPAATSGTAVDMRRLLRGLCQGTRVLRELKLAADASPVFLLDASRLAGGRPINDGVFDNRWKTFAQDFPSARFLQERGIRRVMLVQEQAAQPQEDLSHVLLRWQEAGIRLEVCGIAENGPVRELHVTRPSHFRALWQRALAILGLRRAASGGFGNWPHSTGGG
jgi:hypothetical protein